MCKVVTTSNKWKPMQGLVSAGYCGMNICKCTTKTGYVELVPQQIMLWEKGR